MHGPPAPTYGTADTRVLALPATNPFPVCQGGQQGGVATSCGGLVCEGGHFLWWFSVKQARLTPSFVTGQSVQVSQGGLTAHGWRGRGLCWGWTPGMMCGQLSCPLSDLLPDLPLLAVPPVFVEHLLYADSAHPGSAQPAWLLPVSALPF